MNRTPRMRQGLVCFGLAVLLLGLGTPALRAAFKALDASGWQETTARIEEVGHARFGQRSGGLRIECRYRYDVAGQSFTGTNVDFQCGKDGQAGTVQRRFEALQQAQQAGTKVPCFHHPQHPDRAVLYRIPDGRQAALIGGTAILLFWCWLTAADGRFLGRPPRGSLRSGAALLSGALLVANPQFELRSPYNFLAIALIAFAASWFHLNATAPRPTSNPGN